MKSKNTYKDYLEIPDEFKLRLPTSFDVVGDVIILKMDKDLYKYSSAVKEAFLKKFKYIKHVGIDEGVSGKYRLRKIVFINDDFDGTTTYKENGILLKVDLCNAYFSPRLSYERSLVLSAINDGETIVDMFTGIGPFTILIAKKKKVKAIYGIDINERSISMLKENIKLNKISAPVYPLLMDAKEALEIIEPADRYIMNHPSSAMNFLPAVSEKAFKGSKIHLYLLTTEDEFTAHIKSDIENLGFEILNKRVVHPYSPVLNVYSILLRKVL
ncbi:MAG: methyltransferase [Candidatus Thermoplasmatota archaeon]|jgi:tRNA (guanine37-N1)-methyltransferase|nr:methyltransferase [Candidatus Thermoplasmatota archaeon]MCL5964037.1 methyltransferase [Candidatus Thermoplasmatota archaeon]